MNNTVSLLRLDGKLDHFSPEVDHGQRVLTLKNLFQQIRKSLGITAAKLTRGLLRKAGYIGILLGSKLIFGAIRYRFKKQAQGKSFVQRSAQERRKKDRPITRHSLLYHAVRSAPIPLGMAA